MRRSRASVQKSAAIFARCAPVSSVRRGEPPEGRATRTLFFGACVRLPGLHVQIILGLRFSLEWVRDLFLCRGFVGVRAVGVFHVKPLFFTCEQNREDVDNLLRRTGTKKIAPEGARRFKFYRKIAFKKINSHSAMHSASVLKSLPF